MMTSRKLLNSLSFFVLFAGILFAQRQIVLAGDSSKSKLKNTLIEMGYKEILISGCWLEYSNKVEPQADNGWTKKFRLGFSAVPTPGWKNAFG